MNKYNDQHFLTISDCLARITGYYLGGILGSDIPTEVNDRDICRILKANPETSVKCRKTCGFDTVGEGLELRACHAGLSFFALGCFSEDVEGARRIIGGKVLAKLVDREHCMDLAVAADVEPYRIIEALADIRMDSLENLLLTGTMLENIHESLAARFSEPVAAGLSMLEKEEGVENVTPV